jgi:hypothetical protein
MTLKQVQAKYVHGIAKQLKRRNRQGRTEFTPNEKKAIEFYGRAVRQIEALINQGETECQPQP